MIAAVILAIGVTAVIQAILVSTVQNAGAGKLNEAAGLANEISHSLQRFQFSQLVAAGNVFEPGTSCKVGDATLDAYTNGLAVETTTHSYCTVDLDAWDENNSDPLKEIVPGYNFTARKDIYRRVVVLFQDKGPNVRIREAAVVVSYREAGRRRFIKRMFSFMPTTTLSGLVQL